MSASLKLQIRVMLSDEIAFGPGKADLLDAIRAQGSISAAGAHLGMSYRRTWLLVDTMNRCFRTPLVDTAKGGSKGGGAQLTALGEDVLAGYRAMQQAADQASAAHYRRLQRALLEKPRPAARAKRRGARSPA